MLPANKEVCFVHFIVLSDVLFSSAHSSSFLQQATEREGERRGGKGRGGTGRVRARDKMDREGLCVAGRAVERGKAGRSAHKEGCATRGGTKQDEHQAGGGLPGMGKQTSLPEIKEVGVIS